MGENYLKKLFRAKGSARKGQLIICEKSYQPLNIFMNKWYVTEISNQKISYSPTILKMRKLNLLILDFQRDSELKMWNPKKLTR